MIATAQIQNMRKMHSIYNCILLSYCISFPRFQGATSHTKVIFKEASTTVKKERRKKRSVWDERSSFWACPSDLSEKREKKLSPGESEVIALLCIWENVPQSRVTIDKLFIIDSIFLNWYDKIFFPTG